MNKPVKIYDGSYTQEKFDKELLATKDQDGLMSKEDKAKLDKLASGGTSGGGSEVPTTIEAANVIEDKSHKFVTADQLAKIDAIPVDAIYTDTVYEHPETHSATMIVENETHKFVTADEKTAWNGKIDRTEMGIPNGVATLDESGVIPSAQLPGFVDDIVEADGVDSFPKTGVSGKLYVDTTANKTYRWSGTQYVAIESAGVALGETSATAYAGDKGKATTDTVNAIIAGTTAVPKAENAATVGEGFVVESDVPATAVFTDTVYAHPATHPATMIEEDTAHKFVTEDQLSKISNIPNDAVYTDTVYTHPATHDASMIVEDETHKFASADQLAKVDAIPEDAVYTDTVYEHPETHPAAMIIEDELNRFVTDEEKAAWNSKASTDVVTTTANGLMAKEDKVKLDGVPEFEDMPYYMDGDKKAFFACGVHIVLEASENAGMVKASFIQNGTTQSIEFPENNIVYGGGNGLEGNAFYPSTSITINSGKFKSVYGGNLGRGNVGVSNVIVNGGTVTEGIQGGGAGYDTNSFANTTGRANVIINNITNALTVYGGGQGPATVGYATVIINNGVAQYVTAGGSNGYTGEGEVIVNGGTITVLQGCNRGTMDNIKLTINGGTISKLYAGGETEDKNVTATYISSKVEINDGTITNITAGTNGGVEDATKVSGIYAPGVISDEAATAMNLVKAPMVITDITFEGNAINFKNGDTVVKSIDLTSLNS